MPTSVTDAAPPAEEPADRTKTVRGRIGLVVIGVVVALAAGGFGIIAGFAGASSPGIASQTVAYDITGNSVKISYSVAKPEGDPVRCTLDAFDTDFNILAEKTIVVPAGKSGATGTETLTTPREATGARIHECAKTAG
ncbi:DUF4307 domain-containing protein [Actinomadura sp. WMMB 499]|uniref:DUF4307 domain-containing protein n=1 Tax=Actinomadura sp. WMMB 499 TaxID=1219491 RepID=UPI0012492B92|nr:DUF4307 domain-containing protein [Actinomadura sp. WMMB 499]QFG24818.1 DUF4307 domain-containing protein [Actinomadura sp. WMMB 499]